MEKFKIRVFYPFPKINGICVKLKKKQTKIISEVLFLVIFQAFRRAFIIFKHYV